MKTIQLDKFGGPDALHVAEAADPQPGRGQVRVRNHAIGVNPFDAKVRAGQMEAMFKTPLPAVLGGEIAGVVDAIGAGVTNLAVGDEVFGWSDGGAYAELALASIVAPKPKALSWALAAALPVAGETATRALDLVKVERGDTVLVSGGTGVVGSAIVQLAILRGAKVIATGSAANQGLLKSLGATPVVYGAGLVERVRALGMPVDAAIDAAGKGALPDLIALRGGKTRLVTIADPAAFQLGVTFSSGTPEQRNVAVLRTVADLATSGKLKIAVAVTLPLAEAARAHVLLAEAHAPGKIVLTIP
jgi:NADPH:quinone reductase-like Zn-dependent oxidoreductase